MLRKDFSRAALHKKNQVVIARFTDTGGKVYVARLLPQDWRPGKSIDITVGITKGASPYLEVPLTAAERDSPVGVAVTRSTRKVKFFRSTDAVVSFLMDIGEDARCASVARVVIDGSSEVMEIVWEELGPLYQKPEYKGLGHTRELACEEEDTFDV
jgi:hypothetical protein